MSLECVGGVQSVSLGCVGGSAECESGMYGWEYRV